MDVFMSYCFDDEPFVLQVSHHLSRQPNLVPYCYANEKWKKDGSWLKQVREALDNCEAFVLFLGRSFGNIQRGEAEHFERGPRLRGVVIQLPAAVALPKKEHGKAVFRTLRTIPPITADPSKERAADECARAISIQLTNLWVPPDGLPIGYPFDYEKGIIEEYILGGGSLTGRRVEVGCPSRWPDVRRVATSQAKAKLLERMDDTDLSNPVPQDIIGTYRTDDARIVVDVRSKHHAGGTDGMLTFPEAGPRARVLHPLEGPRLRAGILVSGGIAPGINAVISGIIERHDLYMRHARLVGRSNELTLLGYRDGFDGLLRDGSNYRLLEGDQLREQANWIRDQANIGGSMFGTSRTQGLLGAEGIDERGSPISQAAAEEIVREPAAVRRDHVIHQIIQKLAFDGVDILYVIGGDGSMRAAHAIWTVAHDLWKKGNYPVHRESELSVVAIPKTMDNDILWVWQSFGFLSAVEKAKDFVLQFYTESRSNPRLCIMQLFGSDSGFVVSHTALASGVCDAVLIPEVNFSMAKLTAYITEKLRVRYRPGLNGESPYGMILMAETAIPTDYADCLRENPEIHLEEREIEAIHRFERNGRRVYGQTPDELRTGGLKIVSRALHAAIRRMASYDKYWKTFRVFTSEPRHLLRAIPPSSSDVIFGQRLGALAVDNALAGYTDFMISQWLTEYVLVPLELVVLGRKRVPRDGIFWKSVLANTGQPAVMA